MKALTLYKPWAALIAMGLKRYETRSWRTGYSGFLVIHAGKRNDAKVRIDIEDVQHRLAEIGLCLPALNFGAAVAVVRMTGCIPADQVLAEWGDFSPGRFAWRLDDVRVLTPIVPALGKQGLWDWPPTVQILRKG